MVQRSRLGDSFSDINLRLETVDTGVGWVGVRHYAADAAADFLCPQKFSVGDGGATVFFGAGGHGDVGGGRFHSFVELVILSVDFRLKEHIICWVLGHIKIMECYLILSNLR